jgi:hypothetical protein
LTATRFLRTSKASTPTIAIPTERVRADP